MLTDHQVQLIKKQLIEIYSVKSEFRPGESLFGGVETSEAILHLIDAFEKLNGERHEESKEV